MNIRWQSNQPVAHTERCHEEDAAWDENVKLWQQRVNIKSLVPLWLN